MQAQNRVGQSLGNYRLVKPLGRGGNAEVYLAEHIHLGIQTAIKVLKLRDLDSLEREQFLFEAKSMTTLEHLRIIKILDYGIEMSQRSSGNDGSTPYLVMEYAPLGTLRHLYPHGTQMPLPKIVTYMKQIAEALQYAHDKDITHLDVKPENMLVRKVDDAALSDFGIAVAGLNTSNLPLQEEEILQKIARGEKIAVSGTTPYLAPERLLGRTQRASDQYALAIVVYEWLCGSRPFDGSDLEICQKHSKEPPPSLSQRFPHISLEVEQVVMKALSKQPEDRYKSVREFALALESAVKASSQPTISKMTLLSTSPKLPTLLADEIMAPPPQQASYVSTLPTPQPIISSTLQPPITPPPPPIDQSQNQRPSFQGYDAFTIPNIPQGQPVQQGATMQHPEDLFSTVSRVFVTDPYGFGRTQKTRQFRLLGIPLNILSALIVFISDPFPSSLIPAILGGVISVWMLWCCTISVKKPIAMAFGAGVALWWGFVAVSVAAHSNDVSIVAPSFFIAFAISLGIHIWYVDNRLKNRT